MAVEKKGWFIYYTTAKGNFNFRLKAPNKETVAVCEGAYADLKSCKAGIDSVRRFSGVENIEDLSLSLNIRNTKFTRINRANSATVCLPTTAIFCVFPRMAMPQRKAAKRAFRASRAGRPKR